MILRARLRVESALAGTCTVLGATTLFWRDWIEALTGIDPDRHNGSVEWLVVAMLFGLALGLSFLAHRERRRLRRQTIGVISSLRAGSAL